MCNKLLKNGLTFFFIKKKTLPFVDGKKKIFLGFFFFVIAVGFYLFKVGVREENDRTTNSINEQREYEIYEVCILLFVVLG